MGKRSLIIAAEKIWFSTDTVGIFPTGYSFDSNVIEVGLNEYTKHPWWYYGYPPYVTISLPITYIKRNVIPAYKYTHLKLKIPKIRIQPTVPLRI